MSADEEVGEEAPSAEPKTDSRRSSTLKTLLRLGVLVGLILAAVLAVRSTGMGPREILEWVQEVMTSAGTLGILAFIVIFSLGELAHVPGLVFVSAAALAFGPVLGAVVGYVGAFVSVCVSFWVVRTIGGQLLAKIERPFFKKILDRLESKPIRVTIVLRLVLWMAPPLNYALAMSKIRFRDYAIGSALGLIVPIVLAVVFLDAVMAFFLS
ncbi:MAG: putative membrane protein YdjX (TVP38/TMEM64 family) [Polyangiales bacterium]